MTNETKVTTTGETVTALSVQDAATETQLPTWRKPEVVRMDIGEVTEAPRGSLLT